MSTNGIWRLSVWLASIRPSSSEFDDEREPTRPAAPTCSDRGYRLGSVSAGETHSVKRHLDVAAEDYDMQIRRFIPHYEDMIATGVELLGALVPSDGQILD